MFSSEILTYALLMHWLTRHTRSHNNIYAPGGQSIFFDPNSGRDIIVYHYVRNDSYGGPSYLGINYLDFSSGWPVVVD